MKGTHRYIIVGGIPSSRYSDTTNFTKLNIMAKAFTLDEIKKLWNVYENECNGLLIIIDLLLGKKIDPFE